MPLKVDGVVKRLRELGADFERVPAKDVARLRRAFAKTLGDHPYFDFLARIGRLHGIKSEMLSPEEVLAQHEAQRRFFEHASFGDEPEDEENLRIEQAFRGTLVPFQYVRTRGDFFCFVTSNVTRAGPLILDAYHDDCELAHPGDALTNPRRKTPYTRSFTQHLAWLAEGLARDSGRYPPE